MILRRPSSQPARQAATTAPRVTRTHDAFVFHIEFGNHAVGSSTPQNEFLNPDHGDFAALAELLQTAHEAQVQSALPADSAADASHNVVTLHDDMKDQLLKHPGEFHFV